MYIEALLDWFENTSTNLKKFIINLTCIGEEVGGKKCGERLARILTRHDCKFEVIRLNFTDLVGSRNSNTWIECLEKNQSLNNLSFRGMSISIENIEESDQPFTSIHVPNGFAKDKIYWDGTTFPDARLAKE